MPLDKLQKALQEKLRVLRTEEALNGLFDFSIAFKAHSADILLQSWKQVEVTWLVNQDCMADGVGAPNQELQYDFMLPSPSVVTHCHLTAERQI